MLGSEGFELMDSEKELQYNSGGGGEGQLSTKFCTKMAWVRRVAAV